MPAVATSRGTGTDVTASDATACGEDVLLEAAGGWNDLLDGLPLVVVGLDRRGRIAFVNQFFLTITGYLEHEVAGSDWFSTFLPSDYQPDVQAVFEQILNASGGARHVNPILTRDGEQRMVAWFNTTLRGSDDSVAGTVGLGEDVTDRLRAERAKTELVEQLQRALDSRIMLEQAKGFISCLHDISPEHAFERLRSYARSHNTDIHAVARKVLERELIV